MGGYLDLSRPTTKKTFLCVSMVFPQFVFSKKYNELVHLISEVDVDPLILSFNFCLILGDPEVNQKISYLNFSRVVSNIMRKPRIHHHYQGNASIQKIKNIPEISVKGFFNYGTWRNLFSIDMIPYQECTAFFRVRYRVHRLCISA